MFSLSTVFPFIQVRRNDFLFSFLVGFLRCYSYSALCHCLLNDNHLTVDRILSDLRLYREKPQSSLSAQWDVVVGPTIDQWRTFIKSLGHVDEEGDLRAFLKDHLLEVVSTSLDSGELSQENPELFVTNLLNREQTELNGSSDYYVNGALPKTLPGCSGNMYDIQDSGGGGGGTPGGSVGPNVGGNNGGIDSSNGAPSVKQEILDNQGTYSPIFIGPFIAMVPLGTINMMKEAGDNEFCFVNWDICR